MDLKNARNGSLTSERVKNGAKAMALKEEKRDDTSVLFYDLGNLKVLETGEDGIVYGFGRDGEKIRITPDTRSVYAFQGGQPFLELAGGDLSRLVYDPGAKAFLSMDPGTEITQMVEAAAASAERMGLVPYYLYRQKNIAGNFENVGYAEQDKAGVYNILIMEERQTIIACGAGSTTKLVLPEKIKTSSGKETNLIRVENVKNIIEYIDRIDEMIERKKVLFEKN